MPTCLPNIIAFYITVKWSLLTAQLPQVLGLPLAVRSQRVTLLSYHWPGSGGISHLRAGERAQGRERHWLQNVTIPETHMVEGWSQFLKVVF